MSVSSSSDESFQFPGPSRYPKDVNQEDCKEEDKEGDLGDEAGSFDEDEDESSRTRSDCEGYYIQKSNCKRVLLAMCIGLSIVDLQAPPWSTHPKKREFKVKRNELADEVKRRSAQIVYSKKATGPKPKNWNVELSTKWLLENPITSEADLDFLKGEIERLTAIMSESAKEAESQNQQIARGNWVGKIPHLRLIHCVIHDDIKSLFLKRAAVKSRQEVDGRNSTTRAPIVYELIADLWNDPTFNPSTSPSLCHKEFKESIDCSHSKVRHMSEATPSKVEDLLTNMRATLLHIIPKWEQSGQGDGGRDIISVNDQRFGCLADRPRRALDSRASFIDTHNTFHLYYWEVADQHQLLQSALQRIDGSAAAQDANSVSTVSRSSGSVASRAAESVSGSGGGSVARGRRRNHEDISEDDDTGIRLLTELSESVSAFANEARLDRAHAENESALNRQHSERLRIRQRIDKLEDLQFEYRRLFHEKREDHYQDAARQLEEKITELKQELSELTPK